MSAPKPLPLHDLRGLNEDWKVGDLAECICDDWSVPLTCNPKKGEFLTVSRVSDDGDQVVDGRRFQFHALEFFDKPRGAAWHCASFKKHRGVVEAIKRAAARGAPVTTAVLEGLDA